MRIPGITPHASLLSWRALRPGCIFRCRSISKSVALLFRHGEFLPASERHRVPGQCASVQSSPPPPRASSRRGHQRGDVLMAGNCSPGLVNPIKAAILELRGKTRSKVSTAFGCLHMQSPRGPPGRVLPVIRALPVNSMCSHCLHTGIFFTFPPPSGHFPAHHLAADAAPQRLYQSLVSHRSLPPAALWARPVLTVVAAARSAANAASRAVR